MLYLLLLFLPLVDPHRKNYPAFGRIYGYIRQAIPAFVLLLHLAIVAEALGLSISPMAVMFLAMSALFFLLGVVMRRFRHNYFVGIRTPWTLASEEVWTRTHEFASRIWVVLSLLHALVVFFPPYLRMWVSMAVVAVMVLVPAVYSYWAYRQVSA